MNVYKINDIINYEFLKIPKSMFLNEDYRKLSSDAKLTYALLYDRLSLSKLNNWINEDYEVYLIYTREEIAEDLGLITPEVIKLVENSGFPGMRIFQFAFMGDNSSPHLPHNYIENCIAYTGTHDNNTLLGYLWELDEGTRRYMLEYCGMKGDDWGNGCDYIIRTMLSSHAGVV
ncbi:MAG: 4-alpha-glucanotransferase, partial [Clostridia bacterium]|nr:4-alpha-glucanotransferase [Clostridia bacterium]